MGDVGVAEIALGPSFNWTTGVLGKKDVKRVQSEYLKDRATQDGVAKMFGTNKKVMGACLKRSGGDWLPDLVHEHVKKILYKAARDRAIRDNVSLSALNARLDQALRNAKAELDATVQQNAQKYNDVLNARQLEVEQMKEIAVHQKRLVHDLRVQVEELRDKLAEARSDAHVQMLQCKSEIEAERALGPDRRKRQREALQAEVARLSERLVRSTDLALAASKAAKAGLADRERAIAALKAENEALKVRNEALAELRPKMDSGIEAEVMYLRSVRTEAESMRDLARAELKAVREANERLSARCMGCCRTTARRASGPCGAMRTCRHSMGPVFRRCRT
jgi:hypothetical protein